MDIFVAALNQMLLLFSFLGVGFFFTKKHLFSPESPRILARLENDLFMPALILNTFRANCTRESLMAHWPFLFWGTALLLFSIPLAFFLSRRISEENSAVYRYSFVISNFAFMGNSLAEGIYGDEVLFLYMIYTLPMNFFAYSFGVAWLKAEKDTRLSLRSFGNPVFFSVLLGILLGLFKVSLPGFLSSAVTSAAGCMTPCAMLLTGMVIGSYPLKSLINRQEIYLSSLIRLILLPFLGILILRLFSVPREIQRVALLSLSMPLGLNTVIIPSAYGRDTSLGAGMALISHTLSLFTIPILFVIFQM